MVTITIYSKSYYISCICNLCRYILQCECFSSKLFLLCYLLLDKFFTLFLFRYLKVSTFPFFVCRLHMQPLWSAWIFAIDGVLFCVLLVGKYSLMIINFAETISLSINKFLIIIYIGMFPKSAVFLTT